MKTRSGGRGWSALGLVVLSPLFAESLAGYDSTTGDPAALLAGLLIFGPLYGCPALLIREIARRFRLGWGAIVALSAGFGVLQAGVVDQSMFVLTYRDIPYWDDMVRPTLIEPLGFAGYTAMVFIGGHIVWSFCTPIVLIESLSGARARDPWLRRRGLFVAGVLYLAAAALVLVDHLRTQVDHASGAQVGGALTVVAFLFAGALTLGRERGVARGDRAVPSALVVGLLSLVAALGFNFVPYGWFGVAGGMTLAVLAACVMLVGSRSGRWTERHVVAVAGGAVLARAVTAFFATPLGDVSAVSQYAHNTVFLLGSLALILWAARRAGGRKAAPAETSQADDGQGAAC